MRALLAQMIENFAGAKITLGVTLEQLNQAGQPVDGAAAADEPPFQLDRCHALRRDGEVVRLHYPRWHRGATVAPRSPRTEFPAHEDAGQAG